MDKKRIALVGVIALLAVMTIVIIVRSGTPERIRVNPAFRDYVSAFTSGVISTEATIRVQLAHDFADSAMFDKPAEAGLFDFRPGIKGKAYWVDTRTIEFRPENKLPPGKLFTARFYISKLMDMPDSLKVFKFQFTTTKQAMEVTIDNHKAYDKKNLAWERITGTVRTADVAVVEDIRKTLTATQGNRSLKISVTGESNGKIFQFRVDSVERGEKQGIVYIKFDGSVIKASNKGVRSVEIPSIHDFVFTEVRIFHLPEQYLLLQFSDPLMEDQDLRGLIRISEGGGETYTIVDNEIRVYLPDERIGEHFLVIDKAVKNSMGKELKAHVERAITFENIKPDIRLVGNGVILPSSNGLIFPFEAVNLRAVDVKIMRIYENNVVQFLQVNPIKGQRELSRVGRVVLQKTIRLASMKNTPVDYSRWNRFSLDLSELIKAEPGAIYRVSLSFRQEYSLYPCGGEDPAEWNEDNMLATWNDAETDDGGSEWGYYSDYDDYYYDDYYYDWYGDNDDPCEKRYYRYKTYSRNILASDIGLTAKMGTGGNLFIYAADLVTTQPLGGVSLELLDYQNQVLMRQITNSDGMAEFHIKKTPHLLVATKDRQKAYLRLTSGTSLSLSMFDVAGESVRKGLKGFIYGERGVWRPGDSIYLTFILEDKLKKLPAATPVIFNLINPRGQKIQQHVKTRSVHGFYDFRTATDPSAPTGNYTAEIRVGGTVFSKSLKVETIKPNRLKINLDFGDKRLLHGQEKKGQLAASWLHGAAARNLKARVSVYMTPSVTEFDKYKTFVFDDPARRYYAEQYIVFDGRLDSEGKAEISTEPDAGKNAPGVLRAHFETRVFEEGGDFSIDRFTLPYFPYSSYVGLQTPQGKQFQFILETGKDHSISLVNINADSKPLHNKKIRVDIYKVNWRWWWDNSGSDLASFVRSSYNLPVETHELLTSGGKAAFNFRVEDADWGRYFIRATDVESGHSCGKVVYVDWPNWASRSRDGKEAASMLVFSSCKDKYAVGDEATLTIPSGEGGRALITLESGASVLQSFWVQTEKDQTVFSFKITEDMSPNIYACVSLLQPHAQTLNDLPIRLYGVIPIIVEDPGTHLKPVISMPDVLVPEARASITVREEKGKPMTYTLAVVDEGLLDLTKFKTPDPWNYFYAREALGIKTWDIYDDVIGAYGGELERLLSIGGGDDDEEGGAEKNRANRFKPMVRFFGPFELRRGQSNTYTFTMPQYIGSVRVMVIAGQNGAYGSAEKTVPVKKPLMVLATLPRVVGPDETVQVPVSVFAMDPKIKNVSVKIQTNDMFTLNDAAIKTLRFAKPGDDLVAFQLKVKPTVGVGKVKIVASSGNEYAYHEIEIEVRNPNPPVTDVVEKILNSGDTWSADYAPPGIRGTNSGTLEVSSIPPVNLEKRLKYLVSYPYGCLEQTVSAVFPQLYLSDILDLDQPMQQKIERNIKAGIHRISSYQTGSGGLSYWPGGSYYDDWSTSYAGHFMIEAREKGYSVPSNFIKNWEKHQKRRALSWGSDNNRMYYNTDLTQAYRLYTLALNKTPELGAMNLLRERKDLSTAAKWRLAAAYQLAGQTSIAKALIANATTSIPSYRELHHTYGSSERDQAMILETLCLLDMRLKAAPLVKRLSEVMSQNVWMSTQTTAYCLIAISRFVKAEGTASGLNFSYVLNTSQSVTKTSAKSIMNIDMGLKGSAQKGKLRLTNNSRGIMYARIILNGVPAAGEEKAGSNNLNLFVNFVNLNGTKADIAKMEQGSDFIAEITVNNPGLMGLYSNISLSAIFPSGWEIHNTRMDDYSGRTSMSPHDYIDFRDDRVYTFFSLKANESKTFRFLLNASYLGTFYMPAIVAEAMYDQTIYARNTGKWVEVVPYNEKATAER